MHPWIKQPRQTQHQSSVTTTIHQDVRQPNITVNNYTQFQKDHHQILLNQPHKSSVKPILPIAEFSEAMFRDIIQKFTSQIINHIPAMY